jgi:hypothetical protein
MSVTSYLSSPTDEDATSPNTSIYTEKANPTSPIFCSAQNTLWSVVDDSATSHPTNATSGLTLPSRSRPPTSSPARIKGHSLAHFCRAFKFKSQQEITDWVNTELIPVIYPYIHWRLTCGSKARVAKWPIVLARCTANGITHTEPNELGIHADALDFVVAAIAVIRSLAQENAGTDRAPRFEEWMTEKYQISHAWELLMLLNRGSHGYLREKKLTTKIWMDGYLAWRACLEAEAEGDDADDEGDDEEEGDGDGDDECEDNVLNKSSAGAKYLNQNQTEKENDDEFDMFSQANACRQKRPSFIPGFTMSATKLYPDIRIILTPAWSETKRGRQTIAAERAGERFCF